MITKDCGHIAALGLPCKVPHPRVATANGLLTIVRHIFPTADLASLPVTPSDSSQQLQQEHQREQHHEQQREQHHEQQREQPREQVEQREQQQDQQREQAQQREQQQEQQQEQQRAASSQQPVAVGLSLSPLPF